MDSSINVRKICADIQAGFREGNCTAVIRIELLEEVIFPLYIFVIIFDSRYIYDNVLS